MRIAVFDLETTGLDPQKDEIIEVAIVYFKNNYILETYSSLVKPTNPIPSHITGITGITNFDVMRNGRRWTDVAVEVKSKLEDCDVWCAYNAKFDIGFVRSSLGRLGMSVDERPVVDPLKLAQRFIPSTILPKKNLSKVASHFGVPLDNAHRAVDDAVATGLLLGKMSTVLGFSIEDVLEARPLFIGEHNVGRDPFEALYSGLPTSGGPR
jgi:DNA polymerase III epsilon subunit family exonuclease